MSTTINVVGTIATDPRLIITASGVPLCVFRIASDERRYDKQQQQWIEGATNWFGVVCFRGMAQHAIESFRKGDRIIVSGRVRVRDWEKDDKKGTSIEIEADAIGHDLRWGVSKFDKRVTGNSKSASTETNEQHPSESEQLPDGWPQAADQDTNGPSGEAPSSEAAHSHSDEPSGDGMFSQAAA